MTSFKKLLLASLVNFSIAGSVLADEAFTVRNIEINGLQGIDRNTVLNYMPVRVGETVDSNQSAEILRSLYATGFFKDVSLSRENNKLIVRVTENPTISSLEISGNKDIPKDKLLSVLKDLGIAEGRVLDKAALARATKSLQSEYYSLGKYNARVTTNFTEESRNRVAVQIDISEGRIVQIKQIEILGNHAFSTKQLLNALPISTPHFWSFFTKEDQYSKQKLDTAIESLRSYYLDRGYVKFKVESTQATLTPDRKSVYLVIRISEGSVYTIKGFKFAGNMILPEATLRNLVNIKEGSVFSRQAITDSYKAIGTALGNKGFAFADINAIPDVDDVKRQVFLTFYINPGKRVYVRRINFTGNTKTEDVVLRREMRQMEGGLVNVDNIEESKRRLNLLGYLDNVEVQTQPVPETTDQVDLNYHVTEGPSAQAFASIGYGTNGVMFNAGLNQSNFLGSGKSVGIGFDTNQLVRNYNFSYNDPYYTIDGVQRGFNIYGQQTTPGKVKIASYTTSTVGASMNYSIPMFAEDDSVQVGIGLQSTTLTLGNSPSSQTQNFVSDFGRHFNQTLISSGWTRNGLDKAIFPTRGLYQNANAQLSLPAGGESLEYYKINYNTTWYRPLYKEFIFIAHGNAGFGNGFGKTSVLPFFANYFAGGIGYSGAVRGYDTYSLGPRDSNDDPLGGNLLANGSIGLIFPNFISPDSLRTTLFIDGGNVWNTKNSTQAGSSSGAPRFSTGISAEWRLGNLGVLNFSLAQAINANSNDKKLPFQFTIGTSF